MEGQPGQWRLLEVLGPRDWQSITWGLVILERCLDDTHHWYNPTLSVFDAGFSREVQIGHIRVKACDASPGSSAGSDGLQDVSVIFELLNPKAGQSRSWRLLGVASHGGRALWQGVEHGEIDAWDNRLLEAVRSAQETIQAKDLDIDDQLKDDLMDFAHGQESMSKKSLAMCTATMNRVWQLRTALPITLAHCWRHRHWTKIHVVDFGSDDGTLCFLMQECRAAIDAGLLLVYRCEQKYWHASVAKNTSHMVAAADILVNVDGDNIIGQDFPLEVVRNFRNGKRGPVQYKDGDGTCGRIAYRRSDFLWLRGYDEERAYPMGAQDVDIYLRVASLPGSQKMQRGDRSTWSQAVRNTLSEKVANCNHSVKKLTWEEMNQINWKLFEDRRNAGLLRRNLHSATIGVPVMEVGFDAQCCQAESWLHRLNATGCMAHGLRFISPGLASVEQAAAICDCHCSCRREDPPPTPGLAAPRIEHCLTGLQLWKSRSCSEAEHCQQLVPYLYQDLPNDRSMAALAGHPVLHLRAPVSCYDAEQLANWVAKEFRSAMLWEPNGQEVRRCEEARLIENQPQKARLTEDRSQKLLEIMRPGMEAVAQSGDPRLHAYFLQQLQQIREEFDRLFPKGRETPALWTLWLDPNTGREYYFNEVANVYSWYPPRPPVIIMPGRLHAGEQQRRCEAARV